MSAVWENYQWLMPPFVIGLLVVLTHVVFGREVLRRGIIFIDLTIAQTAALGVVIAAILGFEGGWPIQFFAVTAAMLVAAGLAWTEQHYRASQEAIIGSVYVVAASLVLILLAKDPHAGEQFSRLLSGQILWLSWADVLPLALLYSGVLLLWFMGGQRGFYLLFSLVVTSSVQMVGLYLVFATLVLPSLASKRYLGGWLVGGSAYALGFVGSVYFDLPSGPAVVVALALCALGYNKLLQRSS